MSIHPTDLREDRSGLGRMAPAYEIHNEPQMRRDALDDRRPGRGVWIIIAACFVSVIVLAVAHAEPVRGVSNTVRMYQQLEGVK